MHISVTFTNHVNTEKAVKFLENKTKVSYSLSHLFSILKIGFLMAECSAAAAIATHIFYESLLIKFLFRRTHKKIGISLYC